MSKQLVSPVNSVVPYTTGSIQLRSSYEDFKKVIDGSLIILCDTAALVSDFAIASIKIATSNLISVQTPMSLYNYTALNPTFHLIAFYNPNAYAAIQSFIMPILTIHPGAFFVVGSVVGMTWAGPQLSDGVGRCVHIPCTAIKVAKDFSLGITKGAIGSLIAAKNLLEYRHFKEIKDVANSEEVEPMVADNTNAIKLITLNKDDEQDDSSSKDSDNAGPRQLIDSQSQSVQAIIAIDAKAMYVNEEDSVELQDNGDEWFVVPRETQEEEKVEIVTYSLWMSFSSWLYGANVSANADSSEIHFAGRTGQEEVISTD